MRVINPIEFELMVRRINRVRTNKKAIIRLLDETFQKQIDVRLTTTEPKPNELEQYDVISLQGHGGKIIRGWQEKALSNLSDIREVFVEFKNALENSEAYVHDNNPLACYRKIMIGNQPQVNPGLDPVALASVNGWIKEKEIQMTEETDAVTPILTKEYEYNPQKITKVFNFCIDDVFKGISAHQFGMCVATANFSAIFQADNTVKSKLRYIIFVLNKILNNSDWYKAAANSVGVTPSRCSGANISDEEWKSQANALK